MGANYSLSRHMKSFTVRNGLEITPVTVSDLFGELHTLTSEWIKVRH